MQYLKLKTKLFLNWLSKFPVTEKATKTFIQSFVASLALFVAAQNDINASLLVSAVIGALSFAVSATWNTILLYLRSK